MRTTFDASRLLGLALALGLLLLPACASATHGAVATSLVDAPQVPSSIVTLAEAPVRIAPNGKADIRLLAQGNNAFVGMLRMDPAGQVPAHQDGSEEYIYVISGYGSLTIDGETTQIRAGTMVFMPAGATVSYANGAEPLVALQIFAGTESAAKYQRWTPTP